MSIFSTPTNLIDFIQDPDKMNEIQTSYSEHCQVLGQSAQSALPTDSDVSAAALYATWQNWLESNCTNFVNHNDPPNMFTLATFRAAAGLNANGFRRCTTIGSFLYGQAQGDDYAGCWLIEDIHKEFDALRWTKPACNWSGKGENNQRGGHRDGAYDWAAAKLLAEDDYDASVGPGAGEPYAHNRGGRYPEDGYYYRAQISRGYCYLQVSGISNVVQHSVSLYLQGKTPYAGGGTVFDNFGDSISETLEEQYTESESANTSYEQRVGDSGLGKPVPWCDEPTEGLNNIQFTKGRGYGIAYCDPTVVVLKWDGANGFSYHL